MEIRPNNSYRPIPANELRAPRRVDQPAVDGGEFSGTESLEHALAATPDIRPDAVARGRELVKAETYPPSETMQRLARLFAVELSAAKPPTVES